MRIVGGQKLKIKTFQAKLAAILETILKVISD